MREEEKVPTGESREKEPDPAQEEFIDEEPGAYLLEFGPGRWNVAWAVANLLVTLALAICRVTDAITADSSWWALARLLWVLVLASAWVLLLVTFWLASVGAPARRGAGAAVLASAAALAARIALGLAGVDFEAPET